MSNTNITAVIQDEIRRLKIYIKELEHELNGLKEELNQRNNELIKEKLHNVSKTNPGS